jgi:hypothetical protein
VDENIEDLIGKVTNERKSRYGDYSLQAVVEQRIKRAMESSTNWGSLDDVKRSSFQMIAVKISRILEGDPEYDDNYIDGEGYFRIARERLTAS